MTDKNSSSDESDERSVESKGFSQGPLEQFSEKGVLFTRRKPVFADFKRADNKNPLDAYRKMSNPSSSDSDSNESSSSEILVIEANVPVEVEAELRSNAASFPDSLSDGISINQNRKFKFDSWYKYDDKEDFINKSFFEEASEFEELQAIFFQRAKREYGPKSLSCDIKGPAKLDIEELNLVASPSQERKPPTSPSPKERCKLGKLDLLHSKVSGSTLESSTATPGKWAIESQFLFLNQPEDCNISRATIRMDEWSRVSARSKRSLSRHTFSQNESIVYLAKLQRETIVRTANKPNII